MVTVRCHFKNRNFKDSKNACCKNCLAGPNLKTTFDKKKFVQCITYETSLSCKITFKELLSCNKTNSEKDYHGPGQK